MQRYYDTARDASGQAVAGAQVAVYAAASSTLATLYNASEAASDPTTTISNPLTTDALGNYSFAVPNGDYTIIVSGNGFPTEQRSYVNIWDGGASTGGPMTNPMSNIGEIIYGGAAGSPTAASANIDAVRKFLQERGTGTAGAAPSFAQLDVASLLDYPNIIGDGVSDDTAGIQAAINSNPNKILLFPPKTYKITSALTITSPIILWCYGATINQASPSTVGISVFSSNVYIYGLKLVGTQYSISRATTEIAIDVSGASWGGKIDNVNVVDCYFNNWGGMGVRATYVTNFSVLNSLAYQLDYAGILMQSVQGFRIVGNRIDTLGGASGECYGISATRKTVDSLATDPVSSDGVIASNVVANNAVWEGIDTHGGTGISITGNQIYNCKRGIIGTIAPGVTAGIGYAPKDIVISGNSVRSGKTDGSYGYGISVIGYSTAGPVAVDYATAVISGNIVEGYGDQTNALGCAMLFNTTSGLQVNGNTIIEPGTNGILMYHTNQKFNVSGNTIIDPWSNTIANAVAIYFSSINNIGFVGGNSYCTRNKVATKVLTIGVYILNDAGTIIGLGTDYNEATTPISDSGSKGITNLYRPLSTTSTIAITNATDSSSSSTGSLTTLGGVGVGKNLWVAGTSNFVGASGTGNWATSGILSTTNTTDATSVSAAAFVTAGGAGVAKKLFVGDKVNLASIAAPSTNGDIWQDSTQKSIGMFVDGIKQMASGTIFTQTADKTVANTVTPTSIIGTGVGTITLPANFWAVGKTIRLEMGGIISDTGTPTITMDIRFGSTVIATGTVTLPAGITNLRVDGHVTVTCRTTGATGTLIAGGLISILNNAGTVSHLPLIATAVTTVDTTTSQALDLFVTWGTASASNTITGQQSYYVVRN